MFWLLAVSAYQANAGTGPPPPAGYKYSATELTSPGAYYSRAITTNGILNSRLDDLNGGQGGGPDFSVSIPQQTGVAAGSSGRTINLWSSLSWTGMQDTGVITQFDGSSNSLFVGADTRLYRNFILGVSLGTSNTKTSSNFNGGGSDTDTFTIAPYAAYIINNNYSISANVGYSDSNTDMDRFTGVTVTGAQDSDRVFAAVNFNASYWFNKWNLGWKAGYLYSRGDLDGFTESDGTVNASSKVKLDQLQVGAKVAYWAGAVMPYVFLDLEHDTTRTRVTPIAGFDKPANDRSGYSYGGGIRLFISKTAVGRVEVKQIGGREDFDSSTFSANIGIRF